MYLYIHWPMVYSQSCVDVLSCFALSSCFVLPLNVVEGRRASGERHLLPLTLGELQNVPSCPPPLPPPTTTPSLVNPSIWWDTFFVCDCRFLLKLVCLQVKLGTSVSHRPKHGSHHQYIEMINQSLLAFYWTWHVLLQLLPVLLCCATLCHSASPTLLRVSSVVSFLNPPPLLPLSLLVAQVGSVLSLFNRLSILLCKGLVDWTGRMDESCFHFKNPVDALILISPSRKKKTICVMPMILSKKMKIGMSNNKTLE